MRFKMAHIHVGSINVWQKFYVLDSMHCSLGTCQNDSNRTMLVPVDLQCHVHGHIDGPILAFICTSRPVSYRYSTASRHTLHCFRPSLFLSLGFTPGLVYEEIDVGLGGGKVWQAYWLERAASRADRILSGATGVSVPLKPKAFWRRSQKRHQKAPETSRGPYNPMIRKLDSAKEARRIKVQLDNK